MFRLRQAQTELEMKYQLMKENDAKRLSPEDERAELLATVKNDNAEVAAMEQQINELGTQIERLQNELKEVDNVSSFSHPNLSHKGICLFHSSRMRKARASAARNTEIFVREKK